MQLPSAPSQTGGDAAPSPGTRAQQALQVAFVELPVGQADSCAACMADMQAQQRDKQVGVRGQTSGAAHDHHWAHAAHAHVHLSDHSQHHPQQSTKAQRAEQATVLPQLANSSAMQLGVGEQYCLVDRTWLQEWRLWLSRCDCSQ